VKSVELQRFFRFPVLYRGKSLATVL